MAKAFFFFCPPSNTRNQKQDVSVTGLTQKLLYKQHSSNSLVSCWHARSITSPKSFLAPAQPPCIHPAPIGVRGSPCSDSHAWAGYHTGSWATPSPRPAPHIPQASGSVMGFEAFFQYWRKLSNGVKSYGRGLGMDKQTVSSHVLFS